MTVECLLARPAAGKTEYCVQKARRHAAQAPFSKIWVITPGSYQSRYFRGRLAEDGGILGVTVGTFHNFAQSILEKDRTSLPIAPISLINAMIVNLLERRQETQPLTSYEPIADFPGFVMVLRETFTELILSNISPAAYMEQADSAEEREIGELYTDFRAELSNVGWDTQPGMIARAADHLRADKRLAEGVSLILVDGFDEFTAVELDLLSAFEMLDVELLITLPAEENSRRVAHTKALATLKKLQAAFSVNIQTLANTPRLPADVLTVEADLFERFTPLPAEENKQTPPLVLECRSREAEAREALRWIKERVVRDQVPINQCAIFASDDAAYESVIRPIAREYGLPIFTFHRKKFTNVPAGAALLRAITLPTVNFAVHILFSIFHSPYFSFKSLDARVGWLEETARFGKVLRGKDLWQNAWADLEDSYEYGFPRWARNRAKKALPPAAQINTLRQELTEFFALFPEAEETRSTLEWAAWLDELLIALKFYEQTNAEEEKMIRDGLVESFRTIQLGEDLFGVKEISYANFAEMLSASLASSSVTDPNESNIQSIFFGSFLEARAVRYQAVCLLGLAEAAFPRRQSEDPFLREDIRARLGMNSRLRSDQVSVFYQAVTRTDQHLLITRPYMTEKGDTKHASPYWDELLNCFPKGDPRRISGEDKLAPESIASKEEYLFYQTGIGNEAADDVTSVGAKIVQARKRAENFNEYNGVVPELSSLLKERFGPNEIWSSSSVESFGKCAFTFFINKTLGLEVIEEVEEELGLNHIGTINHTILERLFREYPEERDEDALVARLRDIASEVFEDAPIRFNFRPTSLWALTKQELLNKLIDTVKALLLVTSPDTIPSEFEFAFGMKNNPPLRIALEKEVITFLGFIDRIDKNGNGELRVIDYKLGGGFTKSDFAAGRIIQFMIYALAAEAHFQRDVVFSGYWSVNQKKFFGPLWDGPRSSDDVSKMIAILKDLLQEFLINIRSGDYKPLPTSEQCSSYCPAIKWCWQANPERTY